MRLPCLHVRGPLKPGVGAINGETCGIAQSVETHEAGGALVAERGKAAKAVSVAGDRVQHALWKEVRGQPHAPLISSLRTACNLHVQDVDHMTGLLDTAQDYCNQEPWD